MEIEIKVKKEKGERKERWREKERRGGERKKGEVERERKMKRERKETDGEKDVVNNCYLRAALNMQATTSPGKPGKLPRTSSRNSGIICKKICR